MKHRVWCKNKNEWESDATSVDAGGNLQFQHYGRLQFVNMENHVLQFGSGVTDKNDKEIFEGDIVRFTVIMNSCSISKNCEIVFEKGMFTTRDSEVNSWSSKTSEVIGHINQK